MNTLNAHYHKSVANATTRLVDAILAKGYTITVENYKGKQVESCADRQTVLDSLADTGEDQLFVHGEGLDEDDFSFVIEYNHWCYEDCLKDYPTGDIGWELACAFFNLDH